MAQNENPTETVTKTPVENPVEHHGLLVISCDTCVMASTSACDDCMMNVLMADEASEASGAIVLDFAEQRALRLLAQAGMVPTLRHRAAG